MAGTAVLTPFGTGVVVRSSGGGVYIVKLPWGDATLRHTSVTLDLPTIVSDPARDDGVDEGAASKAASKPAVAASEEDGTAGQWFFGSTQSFVFFRLYHTLFERLVRAKALCSSPAAVGQANKTVRHVIDRSHDSDGLGASGGAGAAGSAGSANGVAVETQGTLTLLTLLTGGACLTKEDQSIAHALRGRLAP